jgi:diguanylate cyclase (GGDEF)-like protein
VDRSELATRIALVGVRLAAVLLAPLAVAALRLFPPLELAAATAPSWLSSGMAGAAAVALGLATALVIARGFLDGRASNLGDAAGLGALAVGLAVAALRAPGLLAGFPDGGLGTAAVAGGLFLFVARLLPAAQLRGWGGRVVAGVVVFLAVEAALAGAIFLAAPAEVGPWLYAAAAALVMAAALPARSTALGLLAGALVALALSRPGAFDAAAPLLAMAGCGLAIAWTATWGRDSTLRLDRSEGPAELTATRVPLLPWPMSRASEAAEEESTRLARELRGTIEELLEARQTIELQRAEIARAATVDPLTGVASRRHVLERLRTEAAEARRYTHPLAVLLLDIDAFAQLNHEHGLAIGDAVLRELALRMRLRIRAADALGRSGGDSFVVIMPHTDESGAAIFADALRRRLTTRPVSTEAGEITVGVSIGVAFVRPGMTLSDEELLVAADEALASAKAAGGNRIAFDRLHGLARLDERREEPKSSDTG